MIPLTWLQTHIVAVIAHSNYPLSIDEIAAAIRDLTGYVVPADSARTESYNMSSRGLLDRVWSTQSLGTFFIPTPRALRRLSDTMKLCVLHDEAERYRRRWWYRYSRRTSAWLTAWAREYVGSEEHYEERVSILREWAERGVRRETGEWEIRTYNDIREETFGFGT